MKYKFMLILLVLVTAVGLIIGNNQTNNQKDTKSTKSSKQVEANTSSSKLNVRAGDEHYKLPIECQNCHACDFPTKRDPCLKMCPKDEMITIDHKPEEGPDVVMLNPKGNQYGEVVFSHKIHAQMSDISLDCDGCHHYNTSGPIVKCEKCHEQKRNRKEISRPDLKGALHRQCYTCHRQWNHSNDCSYCHLPKKDDSPEKLKAKTELMKGKSHPEYDAQPKIVYETNYPKGKVVTFFHDEHVESFGLTCKTCHKNDNCTKCHDLDITYDKPRKHDMKGKSHEVVHQNCNSCHKDNSCDKCHGTGEKEKFNHKKATGFDLAPNHTKATCSQCHKKTNPMDKPSKSCTSCHKDFVEGKFNHDKTGLRLNELHKDLECSNCHQKNNFSATPVCGDCHEGYSYPKQKPGNLIKK